MNAWKKLNGKLKSRPKCYDLRSLGIFCHSCYPLPRASVCFAVCYPSLPHWLLISSLAMIFATGSLWVPLGVTMILVEKVETLKRSSGGHWFNVRRWTSFVIYIYSMSVPTDIVLMSHGSFFFLFCLNLINSNKAFKVWRSSLSYCEMT